MEPNHSPLPLTDAMHEILALAMQDKSVKQIAAEREVSYKTVEYQCAELKTRLGVRTMHGAVAAYLRGKNQ